MRVPLPFPPALGGVGVDVSSSASARAGGGLRWVSEARTSRGAAPFVPVVRDDGAGRRQDRRSVCKRGCAGRLGWAGASASSVLVGQTRARTRSARSRVDVALDAMAHDDVPRGEGVVVTRVSVQGSRECQGSGPRAFLVPSGLARCGHPGA